MMRDCGMMRLRVKPIAFGLFVALVGVPMGAPALAQPVPAEDATPPAFRSQARRAPLRLRVGPPAEMYRHCIGGYAVEHRASGDTIVPRLRCWWSPNR
jgi:hypothetical protein